MVALLLCLPADVCQAKSKSKDKGPAHDVFTPPIEMTADFPTFVDGSGQPLKPFDATGADGSEPNIDVIRRLPSLTNPQRKTLDKMRTDFRVQRGTLQDGIKSMQNQLKNRRPAQGKSVSFTPAKNPSGLSAKPDSDTMEMQSEISQETMTQEQIPEEEIKAKIQSSTEQIKQANKQLWQASLLVLTPQQRDELDKMRRGQLMITTANGSQNLKDNNPDTASGARNSYKPESVSASINKAALKRILSNQGNRDKTPNFSGL